MSSDISYTTLRVLNLLIEALVFSATLLYLAIVFGGLHIPSHVYHDLQTILRLTLAIGLVVTSMFSCSPGGVLRVQGHFSRLHCRVASKFGLTIGVIVFVTIVVNAMSVGADWDGDGLLNYDDFTQYVDNMGKDVFSDEFKSHMFDLLGGDKSSSVHRDSLPYMFFPLT